MNPFHPYLATVADAAHGGAAQLAAAGLDTAGLLDFSATTLPGGPPQAVRGAIAQVRLERYPDPHASALKAALARHHGVDPAQVLVGNGAAELIVAIALAALGLGDRALVVGPTFGEYARAIQGAGAEAIEVRTEEPAVIREAAAAISPRLIFLCNPNNPTGHLWSQEDLDALAETSFLVVDQAYASFVDPEPACTPLGDRVILRSLTKDCGLAGLRLGYAVGTPEILGAIRTLLPPWSVNALAQAAGVAAIGSHAEIQSRIRNLMVERDRLAAALALQGWEVSVRATPFFLVRVQDAAATSRRLLQDALVVRDASSFGLSEWIRLSPQQPFENDRLISAMAALRQEIASGSPPVDRSPR